MGSGRFREIDHAADLGLDLEGSDPGSVLEAAQRGLVHVLFGEIPPISATEERTIELAAESYAELLKAWCEALYRLLEDEGFVALESRVDDPDPASFRAAARGAKLTREALAAASELKAVTWHQLALEPSRAGGWRGRVIFDV